MLGNVTLRTVFQPAAQSPRTVLKAARGSMDCQTTGPVGILFEDIGKKISMRDSQRLCSARLVSTTTPQSQESL